MYVSKAFIAIILISLTGFSLKAQKTNDVIILEQVIIGDDTLPMIKLEPVEINSTHLRNIKNLDYRMKRHIRIAYPYALRTARIVNQVEAELSKLEKKRDRRKYKNSTEKVLKQRFKEDLKNLTKTQGKMLIKLIYRETGGRTVHSLLQQFQSNFTAGFWQMFAKTWDLDLKDEYHPDTNEQDASIEKYVQYLDKLYQRNGFKKQIENEEINTSVQSKERKGK